MPPPPESPAISPWRTVIATLAICAMQLGAYLYAVRHGLTSESAQAFGSLCLWTTTAALGVAAKSLGEHLGQGGGIKGMIAALTTDAKPGDPAP